MRRSSAGSQTTPPARLWVFSTSTSVVGGKIAWPRGLIAATSSVAVNSPSVPISANCTPALAAPAPVSCQTACVSRPTITSSPGCVSSFSASWLAMCPVGTHSAASLSSSAATTSCRRFTVGSSPYWSSPTGAAAIAARIASVGWVTVSERRSIVMGLTLRPRTPRRVPGMTEPGAYWPRPWTCEDGGPRRLGVPQGQAGLAIRPGERLELAAVRDAAATGMLIRREPGELFALRHELPRRAQGPPVRSWVERLDPLTLGPLAASPRLPGGPFWPGGMAAHACGDLHVVLGHWAHRLSADLEVLASHRLPVERPHNSFVVLDGGELVMKDCDAPAGLVPSTVSVLDPLTLLPVAPALVLPEPSIARLSSDGERVIAVGTTQLFRLTLDRAAGRLVLDEEWRPRYGPEPGRSYGWDPVISDDHVIWMDNGRNDTDATMLGSAVTPAAVRLWWARHDDDAARSVEVSGLPYGTQSNPPAGIPSAVSSSVTTRATPSWGPGG